MAQWKRLHTNHPHVNRQSCYVADRAGASLASGDHPLIRSFASLRPPSHLHPNVLRTSSFETCTLCQNSPHSSPRLSLSLSLSLPQSGSLFSSLIPHPRSSSCTRVCANAHRDIDNAYIIHAISRIYRVLRNTRRILWLIQVAFSKYDCVVSIFSNCKWLDVND